ncbi:MAG: hypothetical protein E6R05_02295 [Candidatus Moraniibacteriota bacterium]|nr:MAG: hypothetical protein E6R05_02295 [Candidatus Moranbacteria bacterium]
MKFAEIVRSSPLVRDSFRELPLIDIWWRLILALHGKPVGIDSGSDETKVVLAKGFRFYGLLYASLAIVHAIAIPVILAAGIPDAGYWGALMLGSACYLGMTSTLALSGAANLSLRLHSARAHLIVFFVAVIAYLACFCGVVMAITHGAFPGYDFLILLAVLLFMLLGIASYLIEILYLVLETGTAIDPGRRF